MVLGLIGELIKGIWKLFCIELKIDTFKFQIWHFFAFIILIALILNMIFNNRGDKEK